MEIKRILTPQIVSVLFNITDEEEIAKTTDFLMGIVIETQQNLAKDFLLGKGINQNDIDNFFNNEDSQNDQIAQLLGSEEMSNQYVEGYNSVLELIYNQQLRSMDDERKKKLNQILELEEKAKEVTIQNLDIQSQIMTTIGDLKKSGQVTQEQVDEILGNAYDKVFGQESMPKVAMGQTSAGEDLSIQHSATVPQTLPETQKVEDSHDTTVPDIAQQPASQSTQIPEMQPINPIEATDSTNQPYDNPPIPPTT